MQDSKRLPFFLLGKPSLLPSLYNSASYIYKCLYRLAILRKSLEIPRIVRANSTCSHIYKQPRNGLSTRKDLTGRQFMLLYPSSLHSALHAALNKRHSTPGEHSQPRPPESRVVSAPASVSMTAHGSQAAGYGDPSCDTLGK